MKLGKKGQFELTNIGGLGFSITTLVTTIFVALLCGIGFIIAFVIMRYNIRIEIHSKRGGGGTKVLFDYGKIVTEKGIRKLRLLKRKKEIPVPPREFFYTLRGNKEKIFFFEDVSGRIHPAGFRLGADGKMFLQPEYEQEKAWFVMEREQAEQAYKKQGFWEKYQFMIVTAGMIAFVLIVIIFTLQKFESWGARIGDLARAVEVYCTGGLSKP